MNENINIPKHLPQAELQEVLRQHRCSPRLYRYYDREGRLAWSCNDHNPRYTYYLYNDEREIIEIGESFINAGALGHVVTVQLCSTKEAGEFILAKAGRDNVIRLAPEPIPDTIIPAPTSEVILTASIPGSTDNPASPTDADPAIQFTTLPLPPAVEEMTVDTAFADQLLIAIFAVPGDDLSSAHSLLQQQATPTYTQQQISDHSGHSGSSSLYSPKHHYPTQQQLHKQLITATQRHKNQSALLYYPTTPFRHIYLQNTS